MSQEEKPLLFQLFDWIADMIDRYVFGKTQPEQEGTPPDAEEPKVDKVYSQDQYDVEAREQAMQPDTEYEKPTQTTTTEGRETTTRTSTGDGRTTPRMDRG